MQKKTNILIIDDNIDLSQNLNDVLTEIGYKAVVALDGKSAINLCRKKDFDLALVDMKLPDMDGLDLIEKLLEILPELEYIIITAYGTLESAKKATGFKKIVAYELKPLDIDHLLVLIHQVIERKKAEKILIKTKEQYRLLVEQTGQMMYDYNILTGEINWSGDIATITGYTYEEFSKINISVWEKMIHPEDRKSALESLDKAKNNSSAYHVEYRFKQKSREYLYIEDNGLFITDKNGNAIQMLGIMKDITERKQAEEALQESEQRFRILLENVPTVAVQGYNTDGDIHYWNKANESIYGYKAEEAIGKNLIDLIIPPEMKEDVRKIIRHGAKIGEMPPAAEMTLIRKDGKPVTVFSSHAVVQQSGKEPELFCIDVDLTERKQAEEELAKYREHLEELVQERTKELEEKNEKLAQFNKLFVDREFRIKELKDKVKELEKKVSG